MKDAFFQSCESLIGADHVDATADPPVLCPPSVEFAAELVRWCHEAGRGIRILGGGTCPSADDPALVPVSTRLLDAVMEINREDYLVIVQAGVVVDEVVSHAEASRLYLTVFLPDGDVATIGGTYISGAFVSGTASDGTVAKSVIGVKAISAQGELVTFGGKTVKNVTGFETVRFLAGTRGLYAIAVELIIKTLPMPEYRTIMTATAAPGSAAGLLNLHGGGTPGAARMTVLAPDGLGGEVVAGFQFEGFRDIINRALGVLDQRLSDIFGVSVKADDDARFTDRHRALARTMAVPDTYTVTVPPAAASDFLDGVMRFVPDSPLIGHIGYGRFEISGIYADNLRKLEKLALALGGCPPTAWEDVARRGNGPLLTETERALAVSLKRELDPKGILNPHLQLS
ncbi:FAD-binding oxidoreductase [Candidatus Latescibacterota bacterium]